jgi:hypothetical protein
MEVDKAKFLSLAGQMMQISQFIQSLLHGFTGHQLLEFQRKHGVDRLMDFLELPIARSDALRLFKSINKFDEVSLAKKFAERAKMEIEKLEQKVGKLSSLGQ